MTTLCSNCSSVIPEGLESCAGCGAAVAPPEFEPAPPPVPLFNSLSTAQDLEGLSGWLIFVALGLVVSPFRILYTLFGADLPVLLGAKYQPYLAQHPALEGLLVFEVITNIVLFTAVLSLLFLFFKKKKGFPTYMIIYLVLQFVVVFGDIVATHTLFPSANQTTAYGEVSRTFIGAMIWIPYFLVSRRVKATFVR